MENRTPRLLWSTQRFIPGHEKTGVTSHAAPTDDIFANENDEDEISLQVSARKLLHHVFDPAVNVDSADLDYTLSQKRARHFHCTYAVFDGVKSKENSICHLEQVFPSISEPSSWSLAAEFVHQRSAEHIQFTKFSQPLVTAPQLILLAVFED
ncbi:hypothetical protein M406DRAFT_333206 [Cryphonectria parasitica EP155]|uniref:Uncharacterized protein n=1 Tax=Cryphonectria parasitica (strain ATCC 38755 / EP155) TaxID=660469 RepID=A0A9P5CM30_CRYP1|nr:uncharacterized protein M406DRAFT_333206 [Cryphonectria parasitica EP155]KAF3762842.1 hypothetical protein M406DRAFT_333206 [Cryphonectria parasitica EP155]